MSEKLEHRIGPAELHAGEKASVALIVGMVGALSGAATGSMLYAYDIPLLQYGKQAVDYLIR